MAVADIFWVAVIGVIGIAFLASSIKVLAEFERVVVFRLGRLFGLKGPGLIMVIPIIDSVVRIDLRTRVVDVPKQRIITKDNVSVDVDAVVYYRVFDANKAVVQVQNYTVATGLLAQTTLRDIIGQVELDDLLSERDDLNKKLQEALDLSTDPWGIKVTAVTIKDVSLPENMQRAIAKQAEAEREKRSRIIMAEGEFQASQKMTDAAKLYDKNPSAMKLRELQTLTEIAREKNLIVVSGGTDVGNIAAISKGLSKSKSE
ncbi:MAG: slipin family protein [Candidatus Thermoplasmatota archaeon]|nr:slipin family protein [Candidatus Thermoplasmatota archaeon]